MDIIEFARKYIRVKGPDGVSRPMSEQMIKRLEFFAEGDVEFIHTRVHGKQFISKGSKGREALVEKALKKHHESLRKHPLTPYDAFEAARPVLIKDGKRLGGMIILGADESDFQKKWKEAVEPFPRYSSGDRVRIKVGHPMWRLEKMVDGKLVKLDEVEWFDGAPERVGKIATILYHTETQGKFKYCLEIDGNRSSWYSELQLEPYQYVSKA